MKFQSSLGILLLLFFSCDNQAHLDEIRQHRRDVFKAFSNPRTSPIEEKELSFFSGLKYFDINSDYRVKCSLSKHVGLQKYQMIRSKGDTVLYDVAGTLSGHLLENPFQLTAFYSQDSSELFLPFWDHSNGAETYGGGRYVDVQKLESLWVLDFNKSYNPYCSYNPEYTCPIPPKENLIEQKVLAGEKSYSH